MLFLLGVKHVGLIDGEGLGGRWHGLVGLCEDGVHDELSPSRNRDAKLEGYEALSKERGKVGSNQGTNNTAPRSAHPNGPKLVKVMWVLVKCKEDLRAKGTDLYRADARKRSALRNQGRERSVEGHITNRMKHSHIRSKLGVPVAVPRLILARADSNEALEA